MTFAILASTPNDTATAVLFYVFALMAGGAALAVVISRNIVRMAVALLFTLAGVAGLYFLLSAEFLAAVQLVVYAGGTLILIVFGVMLTSKSPFSRYEPKAGELVVALAVGVTLLVALVLAIPSGATAAQVAATSWSMADAFKTESLPEDLRGRVSYDAARQRLVFRGRMSDADRDGLLKRVVEEEQDQTKVAAANPDFRLTPGADAAALRASIGGLRDRSQRYFFPERPLMTGENYPVITLGQALLGDYLLPFEIVSVLLLAVMIGATYLAKGRRHVEAPSAMGPSMGMSGTARPGS